jgi:hypothetical protein
MSSKWPTSANTLPSSLWSDDWKEEDLELLDVVIPGGDPGLGRMLLMICSRIMTAFQREWRE